MGKIDLYLKKQLIIMFEVGDIKIGLLRMTVFGLVDAFSEETISLLLWVELYPPKDVEVLTPSIYECNLIWK